MKKSPSSRASNSQGSARLPGHRRTREAFRQAPPTEARPDALGPGGRLTPQCEAGAELAGAFGSVTLAVPSAQSNVVHAAMTARRGRPISPTPGHSRDTRLRTLDANERGFRLVRQYVPEMPYRLRHSHAHNRILPASNQRTGLDRPLGDGSGAKLLRCAISNGCSWQRVARQATRLDLFGCV